MLQTKILSARTGDEIADTRTEDLLDIILDEILASPQCWDLVSRHLDSAILGEIPVKLVSLGPGEAQRVRQSLSPGRVESLDFPALEEPKPGLVEGLYSEPIAIVGMAFRLPGASDPSSLWELLESGSSTVSQIPETRFKIDKGLDNGVLGRPLKASTGNFLDNVDLFDHEFFRVSPREARSMDPQQRLLLHVTHEALQNAGYVPNSTSTFNPETFGVFVGAATSDYVQNSQHEIDVHYASGTLSAFLSGRISYAMSFGGPSMVTNTACSSSGVALYQAVRSLQSKDCNAALAGGVNIISSPDLFLGLDAGRFLTHFGQSKPFDANADGYSRAEGCVLFVLKRLNDAINEGDTVLGVIRGVEVSQSGQASSITRTHIPSQTALISKVLSKAGVSPGDVKLVEAHAAGTRLGDTNEIRAIQNMFGVEDRSRDPLYLTSIKGNIGHLEAASGAASLVKVLLALQHRRIPRQIGINVLNPALENYRPCRIIVPDEHVEWPKDSGGYALINNYGAAGSNVAILIQEYPQKTQTDDFPTGLEHIFAISAPDERYLGEWKDKFLEWLQHPSNQNVQNFDIAYTSTARQQIYDYRISFPCNSDRQELIRGLQHAPIEQVNRKEPKVVFVYAGQGSQYRGMGLLLYQTSLSFKRDIDDCVAIALEHGIPSFLPYVIDRISETATIDHPETEHLAIFAFEYALSRLWMSWGVAPVALIGHSLGEYAALVTAHVLSLQDAIVLISRRARLVETLCSTVSTGMLTAHINHAIILQILESDGRFPDVSIACFNSEEHCTIAGPLTQLQALNETLKQRYGKHNTRFLQVPVGYHSQAMMPIIPQFVIALKSVQFEHPQVSIASTVTGQIHLPGDTTTFTPSYLSSHCTQPVMFHQAFRALLLHDLLHFENSMVICIEVGPNEGLLSLLRDHPSVTPDSLFLPSAKRNEVPFSSISSSLCRLYSTTLAIEWRKVFAELGGKAKCVTLPSFPFRGSRFWIPYQDSPIRSTISTPDRALEGVWLQYPTMENEYRGQLSFPLAHFEELIRGHNVAGHSLAPASVYVDVVLSGISSFEAYVGSAGFTGFTLEDIKFPNPMVLDNSTGDLTISITPSKKGYKFVIECGSDENQTPNARGVFCHDLHINRLKELSSPLLFIEARIAALKDPANTNLDVLLQSTMYNIIFSRVVRYSPKYHALTRVIVSGNKREACGVMKLPNDTFVGQHILHPVYIDTMIHFAGFLVNLSPGYDHLYLCTDIGSISVLPQEFEVNQTYDLHCTISEALIPNHLVSEVTVVGSRAGKPRMVVARLKNLRFRKLSLSIFRQSLTRSTRHSVSTFRQDMPPPLRRTASTSSSKTLAQSPTNAPNLIDLLSDILHISFENIHPSTQLVSLGLDSLTLMELLHRLNAGKNWHLQPTFFLQYPTVGQSQAKLAQMLTTNTSPWSSPQPILSSLGLDLNQTKAASENVPLVLLHDGSGLVGSYERLATLGRDVWGISNPRFGGDAWDSLGAMVECYVKSLVDTVSAPVILGGWSFGGNLAFEMAKQLEADRPGWVKGVVLIDSPCPSDEVYLTEDLIDDIIGGQRQISALPGPSTLLKAQFKNNTRLLREHYSKEQPFERRRGSIVDRRAIPAILLTCEEGVPGLDTESRSPAHTWLTRRGSPESYTESWKRFAGPSYTVQANLLQGHHFDVFHYPRVRLLICIPGPASLYGIITD
ncbi:polyketide synthase [Coprinopsis marcescibilis]|uniref:Polyketide synthase n=1 Tax=Coprinopsis marcescibilis TaxID=230819 RepID=A0A5C3L274_COPMA|nr:polyketide synthase [Coprinopsis marcescibilis]